MQHGLEERRTPGNTLAVQPDKPYQGLSMFGTGARDVVLVVVLALLLAVAVLVLLLQRVASGNATLRRLL